MFYLNVLRNFVDTQQFATLKSNAQVYWQELGDIRILPLLALAHAYLAERQQAIDTYQQASAHLAEFDSDSIVDLAGVDCVLLRLNEASKLLESVLQEQPQHALAQARLAWCRMQMGELEQARLLYESSAALSPNRLPVWCALTRLCLQAQDFEQAQQAWDKALARFEVLRTDFPEQASKQFTAQLRCLQLEIWVATSQIAQAEQWLEARRDNIDEEDWVALLASYAVLLVGKDRHADAEVALREGGKHYPKNLVLLSQMADLAQTQGRTGQAIHLLRGCIKLAQQQDKPEAGFWVRLSNTALHFNDELAREAANKALELAADDEMLQLAAKNALAQVESQTQNFDLAETLFKEVLQQDPWFIPALQGLGQQHMQRGLIDEAIDLFEKIKQVDPAKGYASLINARRFPEDDATLARLEKFARLPSMEGSNRSGMLLQLAAAWEKRKDYAKAFALAHDANEANKKLLQYDPKAHRQHCARVRYAFCKELYQHRPQHGVNDRLPLFVLGMPRSGTTLVEQILAGHSQICGAGELGLIPQVIAGLERWERHTGSGRHYPDCIDDLSPEVSAGIAQNVLKELREYDADACYVVDKLPHNFENIGLIKFLFPKAKIISVRRDPRDIAISNYFTDYQAKHGGMGFAYDLTWIGEQLADHNLLMHHWHQLFPQQILEIQYEQVVENTEQMARTMLNYLELEWEPQVLAFNELDRPVKTASVWQVRQPIYHSSKAKWMRYQDYLAPLIQGTNRKITWDAIEMVTLPEPGWLNTGVALYQQGQLDAAEQYFKQLLHFIPEHAAANFMLGIVYASKGHLADAIPLMEQAQQRCPWNSNWRQDLAQAYRMMGQDDKAEALTAKKVAKQEAEWENDE